MNSELSAFYFDVRKDALYCDPRSSLRRRAALTVVDQLFRACRPGWRRCCASPWRRPGPRAIGDAVSVHLRSLRRGRPSLAAIARWRRNGRSSARSAAWSPAPWSMERAAKRIGSSLEAAPIVHIADDATRALVASVDFDDVCIVSGLTLVAGDGPADAFRLDGVPGIAVVPQPGLGCEMRPLLALFRPEDRRSRLPGHHPA